MAINWHGNSVEAFEKLCDDDIACFMLDAYQIERQPQINIKDVLDICNDRNILVVLDETKTAGRVCRYGFYKEKLVFDFTVLRKAIGNGYPASLLVGSDKFAQLPYDSLKIAGTYARDGLCSAAVIVTDEIMCENNYYR